MCQNCADKPKFGGAGRQHKACEVRQARMRSLLEVKRWREGGLGRGGPAVLRPRGDAEHWAVRQRDTDERRARSACKAAEERGDVARSAQHGDSPRESGPNLWSRYTHGTVHFFNTE